MGAMRDARAEIAPELIEDVRNAIANAIEQEQQRRETKMQLERIPVDKKKNLSIVMKFLEMQPDNKALHRELNAYLSQQ